MFTSIYMFYQADEDRKNQTRMQELVEKLQMKLKQYKKMAEDAVSSLLSFSNKKKISKTVRVIILRIRVVIKINLINIKGRTS